MTPHKRRITIAFKAPDVPNIEVESSDYDVLKDLQEALEKEEPLRVMNEDLHQMIIPHHAVNRMYIIPITAKTDTQSTTFQYTRYPSN